VILGVEPVERGAHILNFSDALVVFALAQAGSAEIEAQYRKAEAIQGFHGVEHHLVVQGPAEQGMRMADDGSVRGMVSSVVEQRFQASRSTVER